MIAAPFDVFAESRLYVASYLYDDIRMYDGATGAYLGDFVPRTTAPIGTPLFIEFGPDRDLYVNNRRTTSILRFDGDTGDLVAEYRDDSILFAGGIDFGPNGNLFVAATLKDDETGVIEFDRLTGNSLGLFATATGTPVGIEFGPDGNLYAALAYPENAVERFDGATGATLGTFGTSHLDNPQSLTFGPNGNLFVHSQYNHNIVEYNALSGEFIRVFVDQEYPFNPSVGMEFGPDGNLYTTSLTAGGKRSVRPYLARAVA